MKFTFKEISSLVKETHGHQTNRHGSLRTWLVLKGKRNKVHAEGYSGLWSKVFDSFQFINFGTQAKQYQPKEETTISLVSFQPFGSHTSPAVCNPIKLESAFAQ